MWCQRGFCVEVMPQPTQDRVGSSLRGWGKLSQANAYGKDRGQRGSLSVRWIEDSVSGPQFWEKQIVKVGDV